MNNSVNNYYTNYIYMPGKLTLLRNYVARISACAPFRGRSMSKIKYNYIKS